jgi:hypothetical protein
MAIRADITFESIAREILLREDPRLMDARIV